MKNVNTGAGELLKKGRKVWILLTLPMAKAMGSVNNMEKKAEAFANSG